MRSDLIQQFVHCFSSGQGSTHLIDVINEQRPLGMDYSDLFHSHRASSLLGGFRGKRILEMGGALPDAYTLYTLGAKEWVAVEYSGYDDNQYLETRKSTKKYDCSGWDGFYRKWRLTSGEPFDIVYSIAAFEHIYNLHSCLKAIHEMLRDGGTLYSYFTPIWSAPNGSHGFHPAEIDHLGDHSHLMYDFLSLQKFLTNERGLSPFDACNAAHLLFRSNQINRYSFEEYVCIFESLDFSRKQIFPIDAVPFSDLYDGDKLNKIMTRYPGMSYSCRGFEVILTK